MTWSHVLAFIIGALAGMIYYGAASRWSERRAGSLTPEQVAAMLSAANMTPISPEEAVRNGETG